MSSPNHPTSDIEDAFSSNSPNYTLASPDYSPALPGNTPYESSYGLVTIASPTLSIFHDDPYIKVMHAYDAIIPPQVPIPSTIIVPPSPMLSPIFNPQEFFVPEELLPPKEQVSYLTSSLTDSFNSFQRQACTLPPSFLVYTPTLPQIFEIGKSSIKMHLKHHETHIEDILNYLEELSFHRIEKMEERLVNGWMIIQRDFDELKTELEKMPPKRTSTSGTPAMTQAAIRQLVADSVAAALKAQAATMVSTDNPNRNNRPRGTPIARKCTYKEFISCQPFYFNGMERAVGLIRWFERTESVFSRSNCTEDCKVKFATGNLTKDALSLWNSYAKPIIIEQADKIAWTELKRFLTNKYCPRTEVKKMEEEFYNLVVKGNDLKTYTRRFQKLAVLCLNMVPNPEKLIEAFIEGLPISIEENVTASKPQTLREAITITMRLIDQVTKHDAEQGTNYHKKKFDDRRNNNNNNNYPNNCDNNNYPNDRNNNNYQNNRNNNNNNRNNDTNQQQNRRQETFRTYGNHGYNGPHPLCRKCTLHHTGPCTVRCQNCNKVAHQTRNRRS
nr:reverse transcriptase domain-containing protein [Tanacetum cinerariifolium]